MKFTVVRGRTKAGRDASYACTYATLWRGHEFKVDVEIDAEIAAQLPLVGPDDKQVMVEEFYRIELAAMIADGRLPPGRSDGYFGLHAEVPRDAEVLVLDALPRLLAIRPPVTVECERCGLQVGLAEAIVVGVGDLKMPVPHTAPCGLYCVGGRRDDHGGGPWDPRLVHRGPGDCPACVIAV